MAMTQPKKIEWYGNPTMSQTITGSVGNRLAFIIRTPKNQSKNVVLEVKLKGFQGLTTRGGLTLSGAKRVANTMLKEHITSLKVQLRELQNTI